MTCGALLLLHLFRAKSEQVLYLEQHTPRISSDGTSVKTPLRLSRRAFMNPKVKRSLLLWIAASATIAFSLLVMLEQQNGWQTSAMFQLAYVPILLAAASLGLVGALASALVVCLMSVPFTDGAQAWAQGSGLYLLFAVVVGSLFQAMSIELKKSEDKLERISGMYTKMLTNLASTAEVLDGQTYGHSERVAQNATTLGRFVGLDEDRLEELYWAALLHDIGKVAVDRDILLKEGPLSESEYQRVKNHASFGAELLNNVSKDLGPVASIVRAHHERWDGRGYPSSLSGKEIPLASRIITIVDVFEALTSNRPYRTPMRPDKALEYIRQGAARQFDPQLVTMFERCYLRGDIRCAPEAGRIGNETTAVSQLYQTT